MATRCQQRGMLSPLLWSPVVDGLLWELNDNGYYTAGYADDIAYLLNGKFPQTVSEVLQTAPWTVQEWCDRAKLSINPNKMVIISCLGRQILAALPFSVMQSSYPVRSSSLD
jgi:hypothetical protein